MNIMNLDVFRYSNNGDDTLGVMLLNGSFANYTLEDEWRQRKLKGETRIPEGTYEVKLRKVLSGLTKKYREKHSWFTWHLEIQDVPNFDYVYIHIGNRDDHSDGCILVGDKANNNQLGEGFISNSTNAFKRLYIKLRDHLEEGGKVTIRIQDLETQK